MLKIENSYKIQYSANAAIDIGPDHPYSKYN
jgi:hypothetical protein